MKIRTLLFSSIVFAMFSASVTALEDLSIQSGSFVDESSLFYPLSQSDKQVTNTSELIAALSKDPTVKMLQVFNVNQALIKPSVDGFRLNIGPDLDFFVYQSDSYTFGSNSTAWRGYIDMTDKHFTPNSKITLPDDLNQVVLIKNGQYVQGEIYLDGLTYELNTIEDGSINILIQRSNELAVSYKSE